MQYDRSELTDEARKVYAGARKVAAIVWEHFTPRVGDHDKPWAEDWRWEKQNPFFNQTAHGLFLEFHYGTPNQLWTPWGKWTFLGRSLSSPMRHSRVEISERSPRSWRAC